MPAGSVIKGEDGIIVLKSSAGVLIGEVPCLTSWTLEASASLNERNNRCMKSNNDGGSGSANNWATQTLEGKSFSLDLEFFWQENQSIPGSVKLDPTNVGEKIQFELKPNNSTSGKVVYTGSAIIESVSVPSEVTGDITCSVNLVGDGELVKSAIV